MGHIMNLALSLIAIVDIVVCGADACLDQPCRSRVPVHAEGPVGRRSEDLPRFFQMPPNSQNRVIVAIGTRSAVRSRVFSRLTAQNAPSILEKARRMVIHAAEQPFG